MSAIGDIVGAVETRMTTNSFVATEDVFNFDSVPSSIINKAFRIETNQVSCDYNLGQQANVKERMEIYIAYKTRTKPRTAWKAALGDRETLEKDIMNAAAIQALASNPVFFMDGEATMTKEVGTYLVSRLVFTIDYFRSLA